MGNKVCCRREADTTERGLESLGKRRLVATAQIGCKTPHVFDRGRVGKTLPLA